MQNGCGKFWTYVVNENGRCVLKEVTGYPNYPNYWWNIWVPELDRNMRLGVDLFNEKENAIDYGIKTQMLLGLLGESQ